MNKLKWKIFDNDISVHHALSKDETKIAASVQEDSLDYFLIDFLQG